MPGDDFGTLKSYIMPPPARGWQPVSSPLAPRTPLRVGQPRSLRERHRMVVYLICAGWKNEDVARAMGYTPSRISTIWNSTHPEIVRAKIEARQQVKESTTDLFLRFREEAEESLNALITVRDQDEDIGQKRLAARDILDRAGYSVVKKSINLNANAPVDQLEKVFDKLAEAHEVEEMSGQWMVNNPTEKKDAAA